MIDAQEYGSMLSLHLGCGCIALIILIVSMVISPVLFLVVLLVMAALGANE